MGGWVAGAIANKAISASFEVEVEAELDKRFSGILILDQHQHPRMSITRRIVYSQFNQSVS